MDKITKNSGGTTMVESFREALKKARDFYEASLKSMNPTSHYNKEANLTTFFLKAIETVDSPLKGAVSYDEFPVARHFRPGKENDPKGNHKSDSLDSVLYQQEANRLFILEAKEKAKPWNSISWDIIRAQNVVGSDEVFPHALKDINGNELALKYADTDVYGLVLCGYWTKTGLDSAKKEFVDGLNGSDDPSLAKEGHVVKAENVILEEIPLSNPKHLSQGWRYYFVLYCWEVDLDKSRLLSLLQVPIEEKNAEGASDQIHAQSAHSRTPWNHGLSEHEIADLITDYLDKRKIGWKSTGRANNKYIYLKKNGGLAIWFAKKDRSEEINAVFGIDKKDRDDSPFESLKKNGWIECAGKNIYPIQFGYPTPLLLPSKDNVILEDWLNKLIADLGSLKLI